MLSRFMLRCRTPTRLLLISIAVLALAGCKGKCRQMSERLCDCAGSTFLKDDCRRRASSEESRIKPTAQDELRCTELLKVSDCHFADTEQGKFDCGLARKRPE